MGALKKTNIEGLVKDVDTGVLINTNMQELSSYKLNREKSKTDQAYRAKVDDMCTEFAELKCKIDSDLKEIKDMISGTDLKAKIDSDLEEIKKLILGSK